MKMEYIIQRKTMRESFGHYTPIGEWEDLERHTSWKIAMKHLSKISHASNSMSVTHIFRVLQKKVEKGVDK